VNFEEFERSAREAYAQIPAEYLEGVDGLTVVAEAHPHPERQGVFTLGECVTEAYPSGFDSAETMRSRVLLYHGSFEALAAEYPGFDWSAELWETLTHELKHHLESLAGQDGLGGVDAAMDQHFARLEGEHWDSHYYRMGEDLGGGLYQVEDHLFIERTWGGEPPTEVAFEHRGRRCTVGVPGVLGDVHFLVVDGLPAYWSEIEIVMIRRRSWRERFAALLGHGSPAARESFVQVRIDGKEGPWSSTTAT